MTINDDTASANVMFCKTLQMEGLSLLLHMMFGNIFTVATGYVGVVTVYGQVQSSPSMGLEVSIVTFDEFNCVWSAVKLFPARSKAVMLNNTIAFCTVLIYSHVCICHYTTYIHHVCRAQDCNVCSFEGLIYGDCDV